MKQYYNFIINELSNTEGYGVWRSWSIADASGCRLGNLKHVGGSSMYSVAVLFVFSHKGVSDNYGSNEITPIYFVKDEQ